MALTTYERVLFDLFIKLGLLCERAGLMIELREVILSLRGQWIAC